MSTMVIKKPEAVATVGFAVIPISKVVIMMKGVWRAENNKAAFILNLSIM
jgi:hypothetical protein